MPSRYTKDGYNISPSLQWADLPARATELALMFEGVTPATRDPWVHWLVYGIPAKVYGLPEGFKHMREPEEPLHALQGRNSLGNVGYDGPQGTVGRRYRYRIRLVALDSAIGLPPGADSRAFAGATEDHVIGEAELHASYERQG